MNTKYNTFISALILSTISVFSSAQTCCQWHDLNEDENYTARHECSFVQAGESFIMFGGRENAKQLDIYDYKSNTWSIGGEAPKEFNHFQATYYKGFIWVVTAYQDNKFPSEKPADCIWLYFPPTQTWIKGREIPKDRKRGGSGFSIYNDKFYIVAGSTNGHDGGYTNQFDEYDPFTNTWKILPNAPRARDHFHSAVMNNKLYVVGGRLSGGEGGTFGPCIAEVDIFDFKTQLWTSDAAELPTPRAAPGTAVFNNELLLMGGEGEFKGDAFKLVEAYNPKSNSWERKPDMNYARHGTQTIVSGKGVFIAAGSPVRGGGRQHNMEVYGENSPSGTPIIASKLMIPKKIKLKKDKTTSIQLKNEGGNTGTFISSINIDSEDFKLLTPLDYILIDSNSIQEIELQYVGNVKKSEATLTIVYNGKEKAQIELIGK